MKQTKILIFTGVIALLLALSCSTPLTSVKKSKLLYRAPYLDAEFMGNMENKAISESSGLAYSRLQNNVLWTLNDSGNEPEIFAMTTKGKNLGTFRIEGVENVDWEDMASFQLEGIAYLLIADVGDNFEFRETVSIHIVQEPKTMKGKKEKTPSIPVAWSIHFNYEDGARDCESVAVDMINQRILLLSKRDTPPVLYELPLRPHKTDSKLVAKKLVEITEILNLPDYRRSYRLIQPTAMDISPQGTELIFLTYHHAYLFKLNPNETWVQAMSRSPLGIKLLHHRNKNLKQREAIGFGQDEKEIFITSENLPAPIYLLKGKL